jgi:hypothetical protein
MLMDRFRKKSHCTFRLNGSARPNICADAASNELERQMDEAHGANQKMA